MTVFGAIVVNHPWYRFHVSAPLVGGFELVSFERHWGATTFWYRRIPASWTETVRLARDFEESMERVREVMSMPTEEVERLASSLLNEEPA